MTSSSAFQTDADIQERLSSKQYREAFALLLPRYRDKVFRLIFSMLRDRALAEDCTQDVLLRVWKALPGFAGQSQLSTWIYAIAKNGALSEIRKRKPTVSLDQNDDEDSYNPAVAALAAPEADDSATVSVGQLLDQLPERYRQAVVLFYMEDKSYEQTATSLGLPLGTVKALLHRARKRLIELTKEAEAAAAGLSHEAAKRPFTVGRRPPGLAGWRAERRRIARRSRPIWRPAGCVSAACRNSRRWTRRWSRPPRRCSSSAGFDQNLFAQIDAIDENKRLEARRRLEQEWQQQMQSLSRNWRRTLAFVIPGIVGGIVLAVALMSWLDSSGITSNLVAQGAAELGGRSIDYLRLGITAVVGGALGTAGRPLAGPAGRLTPDPL